KFASLGRHCRPCLGLYPMQRGLYGRLEDAGGISQVLLWRADASVAGLLAVTVRIGLPVWAGSLVPTALRQQGGAATQEQWILFFFDFLDCRAGLGRNRGLNGYYRQAGPYRKNQGTPISHIGYRLRSQQ